MKNFESWSWSERRKEHLPVVGVIIFVIVVPNKHTEKVEMK